jgi:N-acyl-D-aspartate/D-glutamate deacylase
MIFAICGLTVDGTGTERAGTSSVCADAAVATIAAHNSVAVCNFLITAPGILLVGFFIAFPVQFLVL